MPESTMPGHETLAMEPQDQAGSEQAAVRLTLADRIYAMRDRWLGDPRFHRWIARFPLSRAFARRKERALFGIIAGFVSTQVLTSAMRVGLLELLLAGPRPASMIARHIGLSLDATQRLLDAAVSLDLVSRRSGGRYGLGDLGAAFITTPAFAKVVEHNAIFYGDLSDPVRLLRGDHSQARLARFWTYAHANEPAQLADQDIAPYTAFMAASQQLIADDVLDAYPVGRHRALLDIGGGDGAFLAAAGARFPKLQLMLFDLPAVVVRAEQRFAAAGLADRARTFGGSFLEQPLPRGADLVALNRVLLDHPDEIALKILSKAHDALEPGGTVLIAETLSGNPAADAYFGFYLLAMGRGRARSFETMRELLNAAGFKAVRRLPTYRATLTSLIRADKS